MATNVGIRVGDPGSGEFERVALCVVSARCDRGWTEHLHHLIYDPLRRDQLGRRVDAHGAEAERVTHAHGAAAYTVTRTNASVE